MKGNERTNCAHLKYTQCFVIRWKNENKKKRKKERKMCLWEIKSRLVSSCVRWTPVSNACSNFSNVNSSRRARPASFNDNHRDNAVCWRATRLARETNGTFDAEDISSLVVAFEFVRELLGSYWPFFFFFFCRDFSNRDCCWTNISRIGGKKNWLRGQPRSSAYNLLRFHVKQR